MDRLDQPLSSSTAGSRTSGASSRYSPYNRTPRYSAADSEASWKHDRYQPDADAALRPDVRNGSSRAPLFFPADKAEMNDVKPTGKLIIENLHYDVSESDLKNLFESIGPVTKAYIRYDRSDRSTGVAVVVYDNPNHALQAKAQFDGAKAKGQVISITQEMRAERLKGAHASQRTLLSRFNLSSRIKDGAEAGSQAHAAGASSSFADRLGPVQRGGRHGEQRNSTRSSRAQLGARSQNGAAKREKRKPVTAADLDAELEAFMKTPSSNINSTAEPQPTPTSSNAQDVDMS